MSIYFEPPLSKRGSPCSPDDRLTSKIHGYAIETDGTIYIPVIESLEPGKGHVGRFLDSLSPRCVIPNVMSPILEGMLIRRGWTMAVEHDGNGVNHEVWVHPMSTEGEGSMTEINQLFDPGPIKLTDKCPVCGSETTVEFEDSLGILCGRKGSLTRCSNPLCYWSDFIGMVA